MFRKRTVQNRDAVQCGRLLALAMIYNGLRNRQPRSRKVTDRAFLAALAETAPDPKAHGVVRWRRFEFARCPVDEFGLPLHETMIGYVLHKPSNKPTGQTRNLPIGPAGTNRDYILGAPRMSKPPDL